MAPIVIYRALVLTNAPFWAGVVLTFWLSQFSAASYAADLDLPLPPATAEDYSKPEASPDRTPEQQRRIGLGLGYIKQQISGLMPDMPGRIKSWIGSQIAIPTLDFGGFGSGGSNDDEGGLGGFSRSVAGFLQSPTDSQEQALWMTPGYRHKGFMPWHDAAMFGLNVRQGVMQRSLQFDLHPFYGQNWKSSNDYWGTELAVTVGQGWTGTTAGLGKIVLRYSNGQQDLMERARGFDMHSEIAFDEHLSLHGGVREDSNDTELGNYVLLRWTLVGGP